jgi:hypothetical protein
MPTMTTVLLGVSVTAADGRLPWVATLPGFVVHGADLTGFETDEAGDGRFRLQPPGEWFDTWATASRDEPTRRPPWFIRRPRVS